MAVCQSNIACTLAFTFSPNAKEALIPMLRECSMKPYAETVHKRCLTQMKDGSEYSVTIMSSKGCVNLTLSFPTGHMPDLSKDVLYEVEQLHCMPELYKPNSEETDAINDLSRLHAASMGEATCSRPVAETASDSPGLAMSSRTSSAISSPMNIIESIKALDGQDLGLTPPHSSTDAGDDFLLSDYPISPLSFNHDHFLLETCGILAVPAQMDFDAFLEEAEKANLSPGEAVPTTEPTISQPPEKDPVAFLLNSDVSKKQSSSNLLDDSSTILQNFSKRSDSCPHSSPKDDLKLDSCSMDMNFSPCNYPFEPDDLMLPGIGLLDNALADADIPQKTFKSSSNRRSDPTLFQQENSRSSLESHFSLPQGGKPKSHSLSCDFSFANNVPTPHFNLTPKQDIVFASGNQGNVSPPANIRPLPMDAFHCTNQSLMFPPNQSVNNSNEPNFHHIASQYLNIEMPVGWDKKAEAGLPLTTAQQIFGCNSMTYSSAEKHLQVKDMFCKGGFQPKAFDDYFHFISRAPTLKELLTANDKDKGPGKLSKSRSKPKTRSRQKSISIGSECGTSIDRLKERSKSQTRASFPSHGLLLPLTTRYYEEGHVSQHAPITLSQSHRKVKTALSTESMFSSNHMDQKKFQSNPKSYKGTAQKDRNTTTAALHTTGSSSRKCASRVMKNLEHLQLEASVDQTLKMSTLQAAKKMRKEGEEQHQKSTITSAAFEETGKTNASSSQEGRSAKASEDLVGCTNFATLQSHHVRTRSADLMSLVMPGSFAEPFKDHLAGNVFQRNTEESLAVVLFDEPSHESAANSLGIEEETFHSVAITNILDLESSFPESDETSVGTSSSNVLSHLAHQLHIVQVSDEDIPGLETQPHPALPPIGERSTAEGIPMAERPENGASVAVAYNEPIGAASVEEDDRNRVADVSGHLDFVQDQSMDFYNTDSNASNTTVTPSDFLSNPGGDERKFPFFDDVDMEKNYNCNNCDEVFKNFVQLKLHEGKHSEDGQRLYQCEVCQKVSENEHERALHEMSHYPKQFTDIPCELQFCNFSKVRTHNASPSSSSTLVETFKCSDCGQTFEDQNLLLKHEDVHLTLKTATENNCRVCERKCDTKSQLNEHEKTHFLENEKKYICETCGKYFKQQHSLMHHRCATTEPVCCEVCGKAFGSKNMLSHHRRTHSSAAFSHKCTFCDKGFTEKSALTRHLRTHTNEKPYVCKYCAKAFSQSSSLNKHLKCHEQHNDFSATFLKVPVSHTCGVCGKSFKKKSDYLKHEKVHYKDRAQKCNICGQVFTTQSDYNCHKEMHLWKGEISFTNTPQK